MSPLAILLTLAFIVSVDLRIMAPVLPSIAASLGGTPGRVGLAGLTSEEFLSSSFTVDRYAHRPHRPRSSDRGVPSLGLIECGTEERGRAMAIRTVLTYEDYAALPADGRRYEIHEGEFSVTPAPGTRHQEVKANLFDLLRHHVREHDLGKLLDAPIDCILAETTIVQPDIVFVDTRRLPIISERGIEGIPTLVVEVLSPSSVQMDRGSKAQLYARHTVPFYWIVDPTGRTIDAFTLVEGAYRLAARLEGNGSTALPPFLGLTLDSALIWV